MSSAESRFRGTRAVSSSRSPTYSPASHTTVSAITAESARITTRSVLRSLRRSVSAQAQPTSTPPVACASALVLRALPGGSTQTIQRTAVSPTATASSTVPGTLTIQPRIRPPSKIAHMTDAAPFRSETNVIVSQASRPSASANAARSSRGRDVSTPGSVGRALDPAVARVRYRIRREADEPGRHDSEQDRPVRGLSQRRQGAVEAHGLVGVVVDRRPNQEVSDQAEHDKPCEMTEDAQCGEPTPDALRHLLGLRLLEELVRHAPHALLDAHADHN